MKKTLIIVFIGISLIALSTKAEACHNKSIFAKEEHSKLEKIKCKVKGVFGKNDWKKEECAERVRNIENDTSAKILYKKCMKE